MIKRDLIDEIVKRHPRLSSRDAEIVVNTVFDGMTEALASGARRSLRRGRFACAARDQNRDVTRPSELKSSS